MEDPGEGVWLVAECKTTTKVPGYDASRSRVSTPSRWDNPRLIQEQVLAPAEFCRAFDFCW